MSEQSEREQIDRHIREKGVTKCPTAALLPTQAEIPAGSRAQLRARGVDPMGDLWRAKNRPKG